MMRRAALLLVATLFAFGCATTDPEMARVQTLVSEGFWEDAIAELEKAAKGSDPNHRYRVALVNVRTQGVVQLLREADAYRLAGRYDDARLSLERALRLQPADQRAAAGLVQIETDRRHALLLDQAEDALKKGDIVAAEQPLRRVLLEAPQSTRALALARRLEERRPRIASPALAASLRKPITLEFRDANLKMIFDVVSKASGINFILDKDIRADARASIFVKNSTIEDAVESLIQSNQLAKKTLNDNSVLIYPNTPQKLKDYQDLVIRNFFLASAEAKQMMNLLKTILKIRDVYIDEKRNLLVIRDTPEAIQLADRLIQAHDQAEPEAMLEVEVIEVSRTKSSQLGLTFPQKVGFGVVDPITLDALRHLNATGVNVTGLNPFLSIDLKRIFGDTNILANPRIRVRNGEKAKIHVGDRVPIISSTISGTSAFSTQTVNYLDVGLKLEVEPQVRNDEVVIKVGLEVSSLGQQVVLQGAIAYQVGTRNAQTTLTLKDGETQVLAGLITDNDRETAQRLPGLGDLPILGRLFSSKSSDTEKTEIILSITPRIVRKLERPGSWLVEYWSGPETNVRSALSTPSPSPAPPPTPAPGVRPGGVSPLSPPGAATMPGTGTTAQPPGTGTAPPAQPVITPGPPIYFKPPPGVGSP
jgi:general secretion pathway protein D